MTTEELEERMVEAMDEYSWLTFEDDCGFYPHVGACDPEECPLYDVCVIRRVEEKRGRNYDEVCHERRSRR